MMMPKPEPGRSYAFSLEEIEVVTGYEIGNYKQLTENKGGFSQFTLKRLKVKEVELANDAFAFVVEQQDSDCPFENDNQAPLDLPLPERIFGCAYKNDELATELREKVFGYLGVKELLKCRLVCKRLKLCVDDSPKLMKKLTFVVGRNWQSFINSTITGKVKSIKITQPWNIKPNPNNTSFLQLWNTAERFHEFGESVQKIIFHLDYRFNKLDPVMVENCAKLAESLLAVTCNLQELHILNPDMLSRLVKLWSVPASPCLKVPENVNRLVLDPISAAELAKILFSFPKLVTIEIKALLIGNQEYSVLYYYVNAINDGSLKGIILHSAWNQQSYDWYKFVFTILNRGIKLNTMKHQIWLKVGSVVEHSTFYSYKETAEAPVNNRTCQLIRGLEISFDNYGPPLPLEAIRRLEFCTNAISLELNLWRPIARQELIFLQKLVKIQRLILHYSKLGPYSTLCNSHVLAAFGHVPIRFLQIAGNVFGFGEQHIPEITGIFASLHIHFPQLRILNMLDVDFMPETIFVHLSKLQNLEEIIIQRTSMKLTDKMFTQICESQRRPTPNDECDEVENLVPAITAFMKLKSLGLPKLHSLTDEAFVKGIALSRTLTKLTCKEGTKGPPFTKASVKALRNAGFHTQDDQQFIRTFDNSLAR